MPSKTGKSLVIVESPTKAKTIRRFLGEEFEIMASMGHVRDLPGNAEEIPAELKKEKWARLGVNVKKGYEPLYIIPDKKKKTVAELRKALKGATRLYIATDEDREGESIGWHLLQVLEPKIPVERMVFHEITSEAILKALKDTRKIDEHLVDAQETRRILDRLVGYTLSPLLWRKVAPKLSAGRVQSVAVRLLVMRERERMAFNAATYADLTAKLVKGKSAFDAELQTVDGKRIANGGDFDDQTGKLKSGSNAMILGTKEAEELRMKLEKADWKVTNVEEKKEERHPSAPFTTSTLQQEANRKLRLSAKEAMRIAQGLYERGLITYMRTDSTNLSGEAIAASRGKIIDKYGQEYLPASPRQYATKSKNAQEAHEAIRPAGSAMRTRDELGLDGAEGAVYDLIWKRTVASQMKPAAMAFSVATIKAGAGNTTAQFRASGKRILFPGYLMAYTEGSDDPNAVLDDQEVPLPSLTKGDGLDLNELRSKEHQTTPPARYTEASLVKKLEAEGIGRPSTYASIMETIVDRGYVRRNASALVPTFIAFAVIQLLERNFPNLVDLQFTAKMEQGLDDIAEGKSKERNYLKELYEGGNGLEKKVEEGMEGIDPKEVSTVTSPKWDPYLVRVGRFGPYVEDPTSEEKKNVSIDESIAPADLTRDEIASSAKYKANGGESLGKDPATGEPVFVKKGPYGFYTQLGDGEKPKRVAIPRGTDPLSVDLDLALQLVAMPKVIGKHPVTGQELKINIGRFGPYVQHDKTYASVRTLEELLSLGAEEAAELIDAKAAKSGPVRELGEHPMSKQPIEIKKGRFGYYVAMGRTFASLKKGTDLDSVTLEEAVELLGNKAPAKSKKKTIPAKKTSKIKPPEKKKTAPKKPVIKKRAKA